MGSVNPQQHLRRLAESGERVRVVAHSLGCRQVIEAASRLAPEHRPHEIHLCAPAVREGQVQDELADLARDATYLYFTEKDNAVGFRRNRDSQRALQLGYRARLISRRNTCPRVKNRLDRLDPLELSDLPGRVEPGSNGLNELQLLEIRVARSAVLICMCGRRRDWRHPIGVHRPTGDRSAQTYAAKLPVEEFLAELGAPAQRSSSGTQGREFMPV